MNANAMTVYDEPQARQLTAADMRSHVNLIQEVMRAVMKEGVHYGRVPGTPKPSLWKPGAETLCATFRIAPAFEVEDLSTEDKIRYRVRCIGKHQASGIVLGEGMGECSSGEEKYKWRKAVTSAEFTNTPENRRRIKYGRGERGDYEIQQVRTEPDDLANTILKMACKRAQVAMAINVTAASDIFTQDIEDLPEELRGAAADDDGGKREPVKQPQRRSQKGKSQGNSEPAREGPINEQQAKLLRATLTKHEVTEQEFCTAFEIETLEALPFARLNEALAWPANPR